MNEQHKSTHTMSPLPSSDFGGDGCGELPSSDSGCVGGGEDGFGGEDGGGEEGGGGDGGGGDGGGSGGGSGGGCGGGGDGGGDGGGCGGGGDGGGDGGGNGGGCGGGGGGGDIRGPQSKQSVPRLHLECIDPGPPSSHSKSLENSHVFVQICALDKPTNRARRRMGASRGTDTR